MQKYVQQLMYVVCTKMDSTFAEFLLVQTVFSVVSKCWQIRFSLDKRRYKSC